MTSQNTVVIGLVAVVVLAGASFAAYQIGYQRGAGTAVPQAQNALAEQRMVLGTIESISGQEITLKNFQKISSGLSASSASPSARMMVAVSQATSIQRLVPKDASVIQKEQAAFSKKVQALGPQDATTPLTPPEPFTREDIALKDLKAGDVILAYAGADISKVSKFTAVKIEVQSVLPMSVNPPAQKSQ